MPKYNNTSDTSSEEKMAMKRNRVKLTEDERKKFDDIGLDEINEMTDVNSLRRLMQYMECVALTSRFETPARLALFFFVFNCRRPSLSRSPRRLINFTIRDACGASAMASVSDATPEARRAPPRAPRASIRFPRRIDATPATRERRARPRPGGALPRSGKMLESSERMCSPSATRSRRSFPFSFLRRQTGTRGSRRRLTWCRTA